MQIVGNRMAPTPPAGDSSNRMADTAFVTRAIGAIPSPLPTATVTGSLYYWNGTAVTVLAGNTSGTSYLSENASGIPSFSTISVFSSGAAGLVPASGGGTTNFIRADGSWTAPPNGRVLLNTLTASNSATLDDTTSFTSTYEDYELIFENNLPATNAATITIQFYTASVLRTTSYLGNGSTTNMPMCVALSNTGAGVSARVIIFGRNNSAAKLMHSSYVEQNSSAALTANTTGGIYNGDTNDITGVRVLASTGNITSGRVKIYGLS